MPVKLQPSKQPRKSSGNPEDFRMSLGGHIDELRTRLIRSILVIAALWVVGWFIAPYVYTAVNDVATTAVTAYKKTHPNFDYGEVFRDFTGSFMLQFKLSFMIGLGLALPYLALQIWSFVEPGLKPSESQPIKRLAPVSVLLFFLGAGLCWMILPITVQWFLTFFDSFADTRLYQEPGTMVMFLFKMLLAFGIGFQLPLLVYIAGRLGIVGPDTINQYWRHALVFVFFTSAILTPSSDPITMLMMAVPLSLLMMISIWALRLTQKKRRKLGQSDWPAELNALDG